MFSTFFLEISKMLETIPELTIEPDLPIPFRKKKRVRFTEINFYSPIPSIESKDNQNLWWNNVDIRKSKKALESQLINFMEAYNDNRLNLYLKPLNRYKIRKLFLQSLSE